jgi:hypothetical protein
VAGAQAAATTGGPDKKSATPSDLTVAGTVGWRARDGLFKSGDYRSAEFEVKVRGSKWSIVLTPTHWPTHSPSGVPIIPTARLEFVCDGTNVVRLATMVAAAAAQAGTDLAGHASRWSGTVPPAHERELVCLWYAYASGDYLRRTIGPGRPRVFASGPRPTADVTPTKPDERSLSVPPQASAEIEETAAEVVSDALLPLDSGVDARVSTSVRRFAFPPHLPQMIVATERESVVPGGGLAHARFVVSATTNVDGWLLPRTVRTEYVAPMFGDEAWCHVTILAHRFELAAASCPDLPVLGGKTLLVDHTGPGGEAGKAVTMRVTQWPTQAEIQRRRSEREPHRSRPGARMTVMRVALCMSIAFPGVALLVWRARRRAKPLP